MPRMDGIEFLRIVKADGQLRRVPIVVLTTSEEQQDVRASFTFGVAGYIVKPIDYQRFVDSMRIVHQYWTLSELPVIR